MAGAIVQSAVTIDDSGTTSTTIAATLNGVAAGAVLVAHVDWDPTGTRTCTVSDGTSYTATPQGRLGAANQYDEVFYLWNVGSGTHVITATFSGAVANRRIRVYELSGLDTTSGVLDQSAGREQAVPGLGTDVVSSGATSATTNANDFILGLSADVSETTPGTGTFVAGTGFTINGSNIIMAAESKNVSATGAQTATFTQGTDNTRITHVLAFKHLSTAHNVNIGQPSETDTAQPMTVGKNLAIGQPSETDLAQPMVVNGSSLFLDIAHSRNLKDQTGNPWANVTGWTYAWYDSFAGLFGPGSPGAPQGSGTFNTNANGEARLEIPGTALTAGQSGALLVKHPNYPATPSFALLVVALGP